MPEKVLKLVLSFDAESKNYKPAAHNLEAEAAVKKVDELNSRGLTAVIVDQEKRHRTATIEKCRLCQIAAQNYNADKDFEETLDEESAAGSEAEESGQ